MADRAEQDAVTGRHEAIDAAEAAETVDPSLDTGSRKGAHRASSGPWSQMLELVVEFVKMSRTTAILLIAFVLTLALYMLVRQDPVVAFNAPPRADTTPTDSAEPGTSGTDATDTDIPTSSDLPSGTTAPAETPTSTGVSGTGMAPDQGQRGAVGDEVPSGGGPQQSTQVPQAPAGQAPQPSPQPQQSEQTQVPVS